MAKFFAKSESVYRLRTEYRSATLTRQDLYASPFEQFKTWLDAAITAQLTEPHAMTLATATTAGVPSARTVLLRGFDEAGFVFYTNYESQKGRELAENSQAALVFFWAELERQIRITGSVEKISAAESDHYFQSRPRGSRLGAWASKQSQVISSRAVLENRLEALEVDYEGRDIPRPSFWGGFRLAAVAIEFWQGRPSRLHDRFRYTKQPDGSWFIERLSP